MIIILEQEILIFWLVAKCKRGVIYVNDCYYILNCRFTLNISKSNFLWGGGRGEGGEGGEGERREFVSLAKPRLISQHEVKHRLNEKH